jgi:putative hydrolase of the HAD superfamily
LWDQIYKKEIDKQYLRNHRFNLTFNQFAYDNFEENLVITEQYRQRAPRGTILKEGCIETLDYLEQDYTLHIITNGFKDVQGIKIEACGLGNYFSNIIVSEDHQLLKPDKAIFRIAETLANTSQDQCVMIGDNFECDVQGALNAGWEAIYFGSPNDSFAGRSIKGLADLRSIF